LELILAITDAGLAYALLTYINSFVSVVSVAFATGRQHTASLLRFVLTAR
jgi:hypothetical protein